MKKLLQKAMVFTLSAAMLVGTPLTASAAPLNSVFSVSDGTNKGEDYDETTNPTGTVTNTDTNTTTTVLKENEARIIGISLDQTDVTAVVRDPKEERQTIKATIKATIVMAWGDNELTDDEKDEIRSSLESKIKWEVLNPDETKSNPLPATILAIDASAADRTVVTLNPKKGNKEKMIVRASIDGGYAFVAERNEDGSLKRDENGKLIGIKKDLKDTKDVLFTADAKVFVKEYSKDLWFDWNGNGKKDDVNDDAPEAYLKHTMDLNKYLARDPETANDTITWISSNTKAATVTAAGVVTFRGKNVDGSIIAISEQGKKDEWIFKVDPGTPASKIEINEIGADGSSIPVASKEHKPKKNTVDLDVGKAELLAKNFTVTMYAKVDAAVAKDKVDGKEVPATSKEDALQKNGKYVVKKLELKDGTKYWTWNKDKTDLSETSVNVTDALVWTTKKPAFAVVTEVQKKTEENGIIKKEASAKVEARGLGKAPIEVKASNGKNAKFTADVKATMGSLEIVGATSPSYSGQSITLTAKKWAFSAKNEDGSKIEIQNKDAVKWYIAKGGDGEDRFEEVSKKTKDGRAILANVKISNKGVLIISNKLDPNHLEDIYVGLKTTKTADKLNGDSNNKKPYYAEPKQIILKQSSIDSITVKDDKGDIVANVYADYKDNGKDASIKKNDKKIVSVKQNTTTIQAEKGRTYIVTAEKGKFDGGDSDESTLSWKSSKNSVASVDSKNSGKSILITAHQKGTTTITVSGVRVDSKGKAKAISTTFKVNVEQPVKTLTINKPTVVLNQKIDKSGAPVDQPVNLKVTLGPKGVNSKTAVHWNVVDAKTNTELKDRKSLGLEDKNGKEITKVNPSIKLPEPKVGDVFRITARTDSGATATSTVTVVNKASEIRIAETVTANEKDEVSDYTRFSTKNKKGKDVLDTKNLEIGGSFLMKPIINIGDRESKKNGSRKWVVEGTNDAEKVTYTVNKKGIVNIDANGTVYAVNSGTVKITAKTPLGSKATLTVTVAKPTVPSSSSN